MSKGVCLLPVKSLRTAMFRKRSRWKAVIVVGVSGLDRLLFIGLESESEAFTFGTINMRSLDRSQSEETISEPCFMETLRCSLLHQRDLASGHAPLGDVELMGPPGDINRHSDDINAHAHDINGRAELSTLSSIVWPILSVRNTCLLVPINLREWAKVKQHLFPKGSICCQLRMENTNILYLLNQILWMGFDGAGRISEEFKLH